MEKELDGLLSLLRICLEIGEDRPDFIGLYLKMVGIWDRDNDEKIRKMILIYENGEEKIKHIQNPEKKEIEERKLLNIP